MDTTPVTCPSCHVAFEIPLPDPTETPCEVDYDCEVCCHPMMVSFTADEEATVMAMAHGLAE